jgi:hypothetical protein
VKYYKKNKLSGNRTAFMFDSLTDYNRFINETVNSVPANSRARMKFDSFGGDYITRTARDETKFGTTDTSLITDNIDTYLFNNELEGFLGTLRNRTINLDIVDLDQQKTIKFTEQELGIFSFDLASLGLIPVVEFFSPLLNEIVSADLIKSEKKSDGTLYFYHIYQKEIPKHIVNFNTNYNGYYSDILKRVVLKENLIEEDFNGNIVFYYPFKAEVQKHKVDRRQKVDENGKLKWSTTFKKSFIYIPKVEKPLPRVDIIVGSSFEWRTDAKGQMIYSSMAAISIAEKLSRSGVNYRIIAAYPVRTSRPSSGTPQEIYSFVTVKKEGEALDKNKIAVLLSDGRQFRYQQFKGFVASMYDAGYDAKIADSIGTPISDADSIKTAYIDYLTLSDSPSDREAAKKTESKIVFSGALSQQQAEDQYNDIIGQISRLT